MAVLPGGVAMFQVIGDHTVKEYNVSCDRVFVSVSVSRRSQPGRKVGQTEGEC